MVTIKQAKEFLGVKTKEEVFDIIYKLTGKKYSISTTKISDKIWKQVLEKKSNINIKDLKKVKKDDKIIKENQILNEEENFLQNFLDVDLQTDQEDEIVSDIVDYDKKKLKNKKEFTNKTFYTEKKRLTDLRTKEKKFFKKSKKIDVKKKNYQYASNFKKKPGEYILDKKKEFKSEGNKSEGIVKKEKEQEILKVSDTLKKKSEVVLPESITVKEFSEKLGVPLQDVMKKLLLNKIIVGATANIDFEIAALIAEEFGIKVKKQETGLNIEDLIQGNIEKILKEDIELFSEYLVERPPIVTIMGHVDHGKTKLLDYIRNTNITEKEAGGITQSIGASQIEYNGKKITFIDTPGHELFTELRARGAKITDIVVIAIAADEGIKQQTIEAINHAKDAGVPIIVAATKIDKPNANIELVKSQISEHGLIPEDWGGDVPVIGVSAVSGEGVDELLEMILLQAEMLELKFNPKRPGIGVILESHKDVKKGVLASVILMTGTLRKGDPILVFDTYGKVRRLIDWKGNDLDKIQGGDPAMILGIEDLPEPGRFVEVVNSEKDAREKAEKVKEQLKNIQKQSTLSAVLDKIQKGDKVQLKLILKADSFGSLEALKYAVGKIQLPENIEIKIVHSDVGPVSDSDVVLADASGAVIIGFNIPFSSAIKKKADNLKVDIKNFHIIYELIDYITNLVQGLIKPEERQEYIGKLEVLGVFFKRGNEMIIGGKVVDGKIVNGAYFKLWRKNKQTGELEEIGGGKVTSLKRETENVDEVKQGYECGLKVKTSKKIQLGDIIEFYVMVS